MKQICSLTVLVLILLLSQKTIAQTYAAQNFTLASVISPETGVNGYGDKYSGCWGWTHPQNNREFAIACSKSGTYWVDVTNPYTPTVSAYFAGTSSNGVWREVKTYQNYCYVVCDDGSSTGFQIFDMSNLPASVTKVYDSNALFKRGHTCWVDGNKLYVAGITYSNNTTSSMNVYSLATPTAPALLRKLNQDYSFINYVHDMFVRNDTVFASCGYQGLYVFKFNSNNTFTQLGSLTTYSGSGYNHSSCITPNGQTLVFMDEVPNGLPIKTCDVSNLSNIQMLATFNQYPQTTPHNPFVVNNQYVFVSSYRDGTQLFDISNPSNPVLAGYFDTYYQSGGNNGIWSGDDYDGQWGCYPYFPSKNVFACDQKNGLFMLKTHLYANPAVVSSFNGIASTCINTSVTFSNTSTGATNYTWTVSGSSFSSTAVNTSITFTAAGIYTVTLKAANPSYTNLSTQTISVVNLQATTSGSNASCSTCADGSATVTVNGSAGPFSYSWTPSGGTSASAYSLAPGCYTVTVNDVSSGCIKSQTVCIGFLTTDINSNNTKTIHAVLFPNPAQTSITFQVSEKDFNLEIFNIVGQKIYSGTFYDSGTLNIEALPKGIYFTEFKIEKNIIRKKLIKD